MQGVEHVGATVKVAGETRRIRLSELQKARR